MRVASKIILLVGLLLGGCGLAPAQRVDAAGGLTVTPAALTITLPEGQTEESITFTIKNQYEAPVGLSFGFEPSIDGSTNGQTPTNTLHIATPTATLAGGQVLRQTVVLHDSKGLGPGSHRADLVITETGAPGSQVAIHPSIRLPVILIKQAGAVQSLRLTGLTTGPFHLSPPETVAVTLVNSGNMITIPRGTITIAGPARSLVSKGTLNTASLAISPGDKATIPTQMLKLSNAIWPGLYKVSIAYGLGGGQVTKTASATFFYIAWWHIVLIAGAVVLLCYYRGRIKHLAKRKFGGGRMHRSIAARRGIA